MEHHHAPTTPESSKKAAAAAMRYAQWRLTPSSTGSDDDTNRGNNKVTSPSVMW